jgi:hypothetical protein
MKALKNAFVAAMGMVLVGALGVGPASAAPVTIAGITVDSQNFANALLSSATTGSFSTEGGALAASVTDTSADTWAFSNADSAYLQLGFAPNAVVNGPGNDLVVWEIGTPDNFGISLTVGGLSHTIVSASSGFSCCGGTFGINIAFLDLSDLGVAAGAGVTSLVFNMGFPFANTSSSPTLGAAAGLNRVPEPGSLLLLLGALSALALHRRRA